jgi:hypothetical protein
MEILRSMLVIACDWPLAKEVEGYVVIRVNLSSLMIRSRTFEKYKSSSYNSSIDNLTITAGSSRALVSLYLGPGTWKRIASRPESRMAVRNSSSTYNRAPRLGIFNSHAHIKVVHGIGEGTMCLSGVRNKELVKRNKTRVGNQ